MYERVLVPTDGSEPSELAVDHAVELASRHDAAIDALFVVEETGPDGHWDLAVERKESRGETALETVGEAASAAGLAVERHLRRGRPAEEILDAIEEYGSDLVVMGTHGRTGLGRIASAGSTTERVVRHTETPVLVVGGAGHDP